MTTVESRIYLGDSERSGQSWYLNTDVLDAGWIPINFRSSVGWEHDPSVPLRPWVTSSFRSVGSIPMMMATPRREATILTDMGLLFGVLNIVVGVLVIPCFTDSLSSRVRAWCGCPAQPKFPDGPPDARADLGVATREPPNATKMMGGAGGQVGKHPNPLRATPTERRGPVSLFVTFINNRQTHTRDDTPESSTRHLSDPRTKHSAIVGPSQFQPAPESVCRGTDQQLPPLGSSGQRDDPRYPSRRKPKRARVLASPQPPLPCVSRARPQAAPRERKAARQAVRRAWGTQRPVTCSS
eukprot:1755339-Rhodomonas_salina.2